MSDRVILRIKLNIGQMNLNDAMNSVMKQHEKTVKSKKQTSTPRTKSKTAKRLKEPTDKMQPTDDYSRELLVLMCENIKWIKQELLEIREELEAKTDMSSHNSLSLKVDQIDGVVADLVNKVDEL